MLINLTMEFMPLAACDCKHDTKIRKENSGVLQEAVPLLRNTFNSTKMPTSSKLKKLNSLLFLRTISDIGHGAIDKTEKGFLSFSLFCHSCLSDHTSPYNSLHSIVVRPRKLLVAFKIRTMLSKPK
jgi:hypothetical protein